MRISDNPLVLDAPDLFGSDKELYLKLIEQGATKDILLRVERAMKHPPKPVNLSLTIPIAQRKPVKSLEDRLWGRYRSAVIDPTTKGKLVFNRDPVETPLPVLLAFVTLLEETGRFHAESSALINWQVAILSYMITKKLELPYIDDPDEKAASLQISRFVRGVIKLADTKIDT